MRNLGDELMFFMVFLSEHFLEFAEGLFELIDVVVVGLGSTVAVSACGELRMLECFL